MRRNASSGARYFRGVLVASLVSLFIASAASASAQTSFPRFEVFGGYSYLPADGDDFPRTASSGFQASVAANLKFWLGVVGDVGGHYSRSSDLGFNFRGVTAKTSVYEFLAGPRFTLRGKVSPFVQAFVGTASGHTNLGRFSDSGFTFDMGGGVDAAINRRLAARVQIDGLGSFADILESNLRIGVGVVARFGPVRPTS
jgi:opacity protein-like surface antigen